MTLHIRLVFGPVVGKDARVAKPVHIQFQGLDPIPILFEDRSLMAIDKPAGWMLIPFSWQRTQRNLQAAIDSSIAAGHFWAKSRNVKFLRHLHRLDAETTGVLLFGRNPGSVKALSSLFEKREIEKVYLAVVEGEPEATEWKCDKAIGPVPQQTGRMQIDLKTGKPAETAFKLLETRNGRSLIECRPVTGRTHQLRVHLLDAGLPILGDPLYAPSSWQVGSTVFPMALRAIKVRFRNPFTRKTVFVKAATDEFLRVFGFDRV